MLTQIQSVITCH